MFMHMTCVCCQRLKNKGTFRNLHKGCPSEIVRFLYERWMENGNAFIRVCARRYVVTSFIALCIIATIILYRTYFVQPSYMPHVGRQQCAWSKTKRKVSRSSETPPWLLLLADYKNTIISGRNLYIWPDLTRMYRLGNRLFAYAVIFGVAWKNRHMPIWPEKNVLWSDDVTRFFNFRIPVDRNDTIIRVSLMSCFI